MNESIIIKQGIPFGTSTVFIIIPFSTDLKTTVNYSHSDFTEWYVYGQNGTSQSSRQRRLIEPNKDSLLCQLLDKDREVYSERQVKKNPFTRGLICQVRYANEILKGVELKILVTYHSDGIGTVTLINKLPSVSLGAYLQVIRELKEWDKQKIRSRNQITLKEYLLTLFSSKRLLIKKSPSVKWGDEFPFYAIGGTDVDIGPLEKFVENNKQFLYGITYQDLKFGGWERIREEKTEGLLNSNLSWRKEYVLYLTDVAMLEIDSAKRREFIENWAKARNTDEEKMRIKLLFGSVQLLELLLAQRFILQEIELDIQQYDISSSTPIHQLIQLKNKISSALSDYYYANAMARQHVSGVEWVEYGQQRFHLEELVDHIKNRVELIETSQQIKNDFNYMRGTYIFQLISILLGSSTIVNAVDTFSQLPFLTNSWFVANIIVIKLLVYVLFLVLLIILTIRYSKDR